MHKALEHREVCWWNTSATKLESQQNTCVPLWLCCEPWHGTTAGCWKVSSHRSEMAVVLTSHGRKEVGDETRFDWVKRCWHRYEGVDERQDMEIDEPDGAWIWVQVWSVLHSSQWRQTRRRRILDRGASTSTRWWKLEREMIQVMKAIALKPWRGCGPRLVLFRWSGADHRHRDNVWQLRKSRLNEWQTSRCSCREINWVEMMWSGLGRSDSNGVRPWAVERQDEKGAGNRTYVDNLLFTSCGVGDWWLVVSPHACFRAFLVLPCARFPCCFGLCDQDEVPCLGQSWMSQHGCQMTEVSLAHVAQRVTDTQQSCYWCILIMKALQGSKVILSFAPVCLSFLTRVVLILKKMKEKKNKDIKTNNYKKKQWHRKHF